MLLWQLLSVYQESLYKVSTEQPCVRAGGMQCLFVEQNHLLIVIYSPLHPFRMKNFPH